VRPAKGGPELDLVDFVIRQSARPWTGPALVCLALIVALFALAGQTVNAPFVYYSAQ
jgi:hypothetical protein